MAASGADSGADHAGPEAGEERSDVERVAEEWAGRAVGWIAHAVARAREEAEDIWAEAQDVHRRS